jgi:hypothetical protein
VLFFHSSTVWKKFAFIFVNHSLRIRISPHANKSCFSFFPPFRLHPFQCLMSVNYLALSFPPCSSEQIEALCIYNTSIGDKIWNKTDADKFQAHFITCFKVSLMTKLSAQNRAVPLKIVPVNISRKMKSAIFWKQEQILLRICGTWIGFLSFISRLFGNLAI